MRCIARAPLLGRSKPFFYLFGPTDALLAFATFCVFCSWQASLLRFVYRGTFLTNALLTAALSVNRIRRKVLKYMQAAGFLAAVECAVRCTHRFALIVVHPSCAVGCSFVVVTLLSPTATIVFREIIETRTSTSVHPIIRATFPRTNPGGERFAARYTHTVQLSSPFRPCVASTFSPRGVLSLTLTPTTPLTAVTIYLPIILLTL